MRDFSYLARRPTGCGRSHGRASRAPSAAARASRHDVRRGPGRRRRDAGPGGHARAVTASDGGVSVPVAPADVHLTRFRREKKYIRPSVSNRSGTVGRSPAAHRVDPTDPQRGRRYSHETLERLLVVIIILLLVIVILLGLIERVFGVLERVVLEALATAQRERSLTFGLRKPLRTSKRDDTRKGEVESGAGKMWASAA